ncbi:putative prophage phiRv2 integrase [Oerskovia enterophila]|uniref:Prophage phiRv2 integrase n=1 Tax=Oerskovia enterophila TaxID=43678 RepID=A0ABX2Y7Z1_9CELL|nr:putative prophage phiRv2 integrase [Oerskovia enterophila]
MRYAVPGSRPNLSVNAPATFSTKRAATAWLARARTEILDGALRPGSLASRVALAEYAEEWVTNRRSARGGPLRPSTAATYRHYLRKQIGPTLGALTLEVTPAVIRAWNAALPSGTPTINARAYALLKSICSSAVEEGLMPSQPCAIRGGAQTRAKTPVVTATPAQVIELADAVPEHLRLAILLGAWCQVRAGEVLELRRGDVTEETVRVDRGVTFPPGGPVVGPPKTGAGVRTIAVPPHRAQAVRDHLKQWVNSPDDALPFPRHPGETSHLHLSTFAHEVNVAVKRTSLPETFRFHHLRHTGFTLAAQSGATVAELQARAGHSTPHMALKYQHASSERDQSLAATLSRLADGG